MNIQLAKQLQELRRKDGVTQEALAQTLGTRSKNQ